MVVKKVGGVWEIIGSTDYVVWLCQNLRYLYGLYTLVLHVACSIEE